MKKNLFGLGVVLFALSLSACGQGSKKETAAKPETTVAGSEAAGKSMATGESSMPAEETKAAAAEKSEIKAMKGDALASIVADKEQKEKYLVIDVRSAEDYAKGHIKFALNMPLDTFKDEVSKIEDWKDKDVVLYCNSGKMSGEAAEILVNDGFTKVYNAEGVKQHSYDLTTFGNIRGAELMEKAKDALVVDAREAKDFEKEHFATAVNVSADDPKTIDAILPDDKNTLIITHCYSGNRSAKAAEYIASKGYTNVWNCLDGTKEITYDFSKGDK